MGVEVCPVHKREFKSSHISSIHVGDMYCNLPKGLKRKYPSDEEVPPAARRRRHQALYNQKRQQVFDLSYAKLCSFRQAPDTSLLRYVLIFNTMRNVEKEMERDGIKVGGLSGGPFLPVANHQVSTLDPPPNSNAQTEGFPITPCVLDVDSRAPNLPSVITPPETATPEVPCGGGCMDLDCPPSGRMTPFVRYPYDRVESGALWTDDSDSLTSLNWSSVLNFNSAGAGAYAVDNNHSQYDASSNSSSSGCSDCSMSDEVTSGSETSLHTLMPPLSGIPTCMSNACVAYSSNSSGGSNVSGNTSPASGSSPTSSEDEIFKDIDLALYDYDFTPLSPPNVKMAPLSAEELVRSLSSTQGAPSPCSNGNYYDRMDDRDHLTSVRS